ncbi:MAG: DUF4112 domain-containing protein [Bacteroidales bacterium]|nr:DUF4112 domain-containing protein [Bacteroidales bacterium]
MEKDKEKLFSHPVYKLMSGMARTMDTYYVDPLLGFVVPSGLGDTLTALLSLPYVWFSLFVVKSVPLTIAVINNILRDTLIGMLPFFVGDVWDIFYRSYGKNLKLIAGYINGDAKVVSQVHRKVVYSVIIMIVLLVLIILMFKLIWMLGAWLITEIGHLTR